MLKILIYNFTSHFYIYHSLDLNTIKIGGETETCEQNKARTKKSGIPCGRWTELFSGIRDKAVELEKMNSIINVKHEVGDQINITDSVIIYPQDIVGEFWG